MGYRLFFPTVMATVMANIVFTVQTIQDPIILQVRFLKKKDSTDVMEGMQHGRFVLSARIKSVKVAQTTKSDNVNLTLYAVVNVTLCADPKHNSILIVFNLIISHC